MPQDQIAKGPEPHHAEKHPMPHAPWQKPPWPPCKILSPRLSWHHPTGLSWTQAPLILAIGLAPERDSPNQSRRCSCRSNSFLFQCSKREKKWKKGKRVSERKKLGQVEDSY
ncbi:hypothetical protein F4820DRAFT_436314 [Hypoxylon rubiginosum]|uniref:Uncharacterized protein n=1 Tax=Hypoxylon rubiginosum TaxID=110542 RepID=A0ACB9YN68_9PEZI|nr:hypothetical protein F4820DRAFT_436314 [Hypoxylon rubiginosum]